MQPLRMRPQKYINDDLAEIRRGSVASGIEAGKELSDGEPSVA